MLKPIVLAACLAGTVAPAFAGEPVFINEIHYDNDGTDNGEAVEVAGPALTDLSGWSLVLYNGAGGVTYLTIPLGGFLSSQCSGFGTVFVPVPGMQNGSPDGVALVHGASVVQFLSYEGTFTATNGPAAGLASTDISVTESASSTVGHSLQLKGTGTTNTDFTWQPPSPASFGACNAGQVFIGGVDAPPSVLTLSPAQGAADVTERPDLSIRFSEAVDLAPGAVTLACSTTGSVALDLTAHPDDASYTFTPVTDLRPKESCTLTLHAPLVSDRDSTIDHMAADVVRTFIIAADLPPVIADRRPAPGATGVPTLSRLRVTFDEPVTTSGNWLTLACATSGAHALAITGGPTRYTAQPMQPPGGNETCTATVHGADIVDEDGKPTPMKGDASWQFQTGADVGAYYGAADTTGGAALRASLHAIIKDHTRYPYTGSGVDTWTILEQADEDPNDPSRVLDAYRNVSFAKVTTSRPYNREHIWPKSYGFPDDGVTNFAYTDTHMLHLTDNGYNGTRGVKPFGNCNAACAEYPTDANNDEGGGLGTYPGNSNWTDGSLWEVWSSKKGDLARALLYMDVRYEGGTNGNTGTPEPDLVLTDDRNLIQNTGGNTTGRAYMGLLGVVLAWNDADPPNDTERLRNEIVYSYQHNRNPFVDHPEWADCVFRDVCVPADRIFANGFDAD